MKLATFDVAGTGFTTLDRVYAGDREPFEALGGTCGNVLISLAMLQRTVAPLLVLGSDTVGHCLVHEFESAGVDSRYIFRQTDLASPVLAQSIDTLSGRHWFSHVCPETNQHFPRFEPVGEVEVQWAQPALESCSIFYADRLSPAIATAMETASRSGAAVFFEPSSIDDDALLEHVLPYVSILKYSSERLAAWFARVRLPTDVVVIETHGADGLVVSQDGRSLWCKAIPAPVVRDTCGSGDMVSVGVIDWMLGGLGREVSGELSLETLADGVVAGQRLATANCAFTGARGLFTRHGAEVARMILDGHVHNAFSEGG